MLCFLAFNPNHSELAHAPDTSYCALTSGWDIACLLKTYILLGIPGADVWMCGYAGYHIKLQCHLTLLPFLSTHIFFQGLRCSYLSHFKSFDVWHFILNVTLVLWITCWYLNISVMQICFFDYTWTCIEEPRGEWEHLFVFKYCVFVYMSPPENIYGIHLAYAFIQSEVQMRKAQKNIHRWVNYTE